MPCLPPSPLAEPATMGDLLDVAMDNAIALNDCERVRLQWEAYYKIITEQP